MVWKPKEKELTQEEALALARSELAPFWHGSEPLLAGVKTESGRVEAIPLDPTFTSHSWLILFVDPLTFTGHAAVSLAIEFMLRYRAHRVSVMIVLEPVYAGVIERRFLEATIRQFGITGPLVLDAGQLLAAAFGAKPGVPKAVLIHDGQRVHENEGPLWSLGFEDILQKRLRSADPGLALPPLWAADSGGRRDSVRYDFGGDYGFRFPAPGFPRRGPAGYAAASFTAATDARVRTPGEFAFHGTWVQDGERIATSDEGAWIRFHIGGRRLGLVARSLAKTQEDAKVAIDVNGAPAFDVFRGDNLEFDEDGQSLARIDDVKLYELLRDLPADRREITLRFPQAARVAVAIYGLRVGE